MGGKWFDEVWKEVVILWTRINTDYTDYTDLIATENTEDTENIYFF